MNIAKKGIKKV